MITIFIFVHCCTLDLSDLIIIKNDFNKKSKHHACDAITVLRNASYTLTQKFPSR